MKDGDGDKYVGGQKRLGIKRPYFSQPSGSVTAPENDASSFISGHKTETRDVFMEL